MTTEPEPLPPLWALDAACEAAGTTWEYVEDLPEYSLTRRSIIAHARLIAKTQPEPVDPRVEAMRAALFDEGFEDTAWAYSLLAAFDRECAKRGVKP